MSSNGYKKVLLIGKDTETLGPLFSQEGLELVTDNPDVVVTHGGDGILLESERTFPGVPKLPIRYNSICKTCINHETTLAIKALANGTISRTEVRKLSAECEGNLLIGLNEISLHHANPYEAIRFKVMINGQELAKEVIGDGLVVATAFGSRAYYQSITKTIFSQGIGLAFNNTTVNLSNQHLDDGSTIQVTVNRGPAFLVADNNPAMISLSAGQSFKIEQSNETATILGIEQFNTLNCDKSEQGLE